MFRRAVDLLMSREEQAQVVSAIAKAERRTTGEIKIHVETRCPDADALDRIRTLFQRLGLHRTRERNAVLLYVAARDHKFAIWGDEGVARHVAADGWDAIAADLGTAFKEGRHASGLIAAVERVAEILARHFPPSPEDKNELSNRITGR